MSFEVPYATVRWMIRVHFNLVARPELRDELLAALDRLEFMAAAQDVSLVAVELYVPLDDPDGVLVVGTWPSRDHYARWRGDGGWEHIHGAIERLLAAGPEEHAYRLVDSIA